MIMKEVRFLYPSLTRKAVTFTIDDGNVTYDRMLLDILKPAGVKGTFNLCSEIHANAHDECRELYSGYGIANHCKYHPLVNFDGVRQVISPDAFDPETADKACLYRVKDREGFYWQMQANGWRQMAFAEDYISYVADGQKELREIFGADSVKDFVWPYREQDNAEVKAFVRRTHRSARRTGCTLDSGGFPIPEDKYSWSYNANHLNLLEVMDKYEKYADDGGLKFFAFGVHSIDFERDGTWDDLRLFADKYGNRPDTYWYASVEEIFDYEEALGALRIADGEIVNDSSLTIYLEINGKPAAIAPTERIYL